MEEREKDGVCPVCKTGKRTGKGRKRREIEREGGRRVKRVKAEKEG